MKKIFLTTLVLSIFSMLSFAQGYNGLIGRWSFNNTFDDVSGNNLVTTVYGGAIPAPGINGLANNAYLFNGDSAYMRVAYNPIMNTTAYSVCVFMQANGFNADVCQTNYIFERGAASNAGHYGLAYTDNAFDNSCSTYTPNRETFIMGSTQNAPDWLSNLYIATGLWYCVVGTYENDTLKLYVDGVLKKTFFDPALLQTTTDDIAIGKNMSSFFPYYMKGKIDELRLYDHALTLQEVNVFCDSSKLGLGVEDIKLEDEISLAPNPAHTQVYIKIPRHVKGTVSLMNMMGQLIEEKKIDVVNSFDVSRYPDGFYFITVKTEGKIVAKKLLKR